MAEVLVGAILLRAADRRRGRVSTARSASAGWSSRSPSPPRSVRSSARCRCWPATWSGRRRPPTFLRTWWLGDFSGALVVVPAALVWVSAAARRLGAHTDLGRRRADRRRRGPERGRGVQQRAGDLRGLPGARCGPRSASGRPGATVAVAIAAGIVDRAHRPPRRPVLQAADRPPDAEHPGLRRRDGADHAVRHRRRRGARAGGARSWPTRTAARARAPSRSATGSRAISTTRSRRRCSRRCSRRAPRSGRRRRARAGELAPRLETIAELTRAAQSEMRAMIFELGSDPVSDGLPAALARHAAAVGAGARARGRVSRRSRAALPIGRRAEGELFAVAREALANVVKHAHASTVTVRCEVRGSAVVLEVVDDGRGFAPNGSARRLASASSRCAAGRRTSAAGSRSPAAGAAPPSCGSRVPAERGGPHTG